MSGHLVRFRLVPALFIVLLILVSVIGVRVVANSVYRNVTGEFRNANNPDNVASDPNEEGGQQFIDFNADLDTGNGQVKRVVVTNTGTKKYFVPTNSKEEFASFVAAVPRLEGLSLCADGTEGLNLEGHTIESCTDCIGAGQVLPTGQSCCGGTGAETFNAYSCPDTGLLSPDYALNGDSCERSWNSSLVRPVASPFNYAGYQSDFTGSCQNGSGSYNLYNTPVFGCSIEGCGSNSTPTTVNCTSIADDNISACLGDPDVDGNVNASTTGCVFVQSIDATLVSSTTTCESFSYAWEYEPWGACSETCGGGTQTRSKACKRNDDVTVSYDLCPELFLTEQACNTQNCQSTTLYECNNTSWNIIENDCTGVGVCSSPFGAPHGSQICCDDAVDPTGPLGACEAFGG